MLHNELIENSMAWCFVHDVDGQVTSIEQGAQTTCPLSCSWKY